MPYLSHADLGGRDGFGPVLPEPEDLRFHHGWERRALALTPARGDCKTRQRSALGVPRPLSCNPFSCNGVEEAVIMVR